MKNIWNKRILSVLLAAVLVLGVMPAAASAAEDELELVEIDGTLSLTISSEEDLMKALELLENGSYKDYTACTISILGSFTLPCDLNIPEGCTVQLADDGAVLTVPEGCKVVNNGEIHIGAQQTACNYGEIRNYGAVYVSGTLCNYGQAYLLNGSYINLGKNGMVKNEGTVKFQPNFKSNLSLLELLRHWDGEWPEIYEHEFQTGDANHDGKINAKDATLVLQKSVGILKATASFCETCANVNNDGKLNAKDATLILQYSVGLRTEFPTQQ